MSPVTIIYIIKCCLWKWFRFLKLDLKITYDPERKVAVISNEGSNCFVNRFTLPNGIRYELYEGPELLGQRTFSTGDYTAEQLVKVLTTRSLDI